MNHNETPSWIQHTKHCARMLFYAIVLVIGLSLILTVFGFVVWMIHNLYETLADSSRLEIVAKAIVIAVVLLSTQAPKVIKWAYKKLRN